ncbi:hypothetical protein PS2_044982 [Malus domestica]
MLILVKLSCWIVSEAQMFRKVRLEVLLITDWSNIFSAGNIRERTEELKADAKMKVLGLLVIDTYGHGVQVYVILLCWLLTLCMAQSLGQ